MIRYACRFSVVLVALFASARVLGQQVTAAEVAGLESQVRAALRAGDSTALARLSVAKEDFAWLGRRSMRSRSEGWTAAALRLPQRLGGPLMVFSRFHTCQSASDRVYPIVKTPQGARLGTLIDEDETWGWRIRDHRLTVRLDPAGQSCAITDVALVERVRQTGKPLAMRLSNDMTVTSVTVAQSDGQRTERKAAYWAVPGLIVVDPPGPRFQLTMAYGGTVNHPGSDYINEREAVLVSYWYPHIGRLPARHGVTVTVPKDWLAIGQGELVIRTEAEETATFTYRNELPVCYFSLTAGPYTVTERKVGSLLLQACLLRPDQELANRSLDILEKAMAYFQRVFGPYPYTRYAVVQTLGPFGGALEAYSFATFGPGTLPGAIVHELAHTWWGGIVPCTYTRGMWNEGFATYSDDLFQRSQNPAVRGGGLTRGVAGMFRVPLVEAWDTENPAHAAVGYGKGSLVLRMLEDLLGQETMLACMRRFITAHKRGEAAEWGDFERAVAQTTGKDYGWWFDQWVRRGGTPAVRLAAVKSAPAGGGFTVTGRLEQTGTPYRLSVPLVVEMEDGRAERQVVEIRGASAAFRMQVAARPRELRVDTAATLLLSPATPAEGETESLRHVFQEQAQALRGLRMASHTPASTTSPAAALAGVMGSWNTGQASAAANTGSSRVAAPTTPAEKWRRHQFKVVWPTSWGSAAMPRTESQASGA